jgi:xanthine dehydrogenase accessory factor
MEIDPRPEATSTGVPPRARRIAAGVEAALAALMPVERTVA